MSVTKRTINYDIHRSPQNERQSVSYHPRVATHNVITTKTLMDEHLRPSQATELRMLLPAFLEAVKEEMRAGNTVHIDGLGSFSPTLAADVTRKPPTSRGMPYEVNNLRVAGIAFRAEKRLKEDVMEKVEFRYDPQISGRYIPEDYYAPILTDFFANPYNLLSRSELRQILGIEDYAAKQLLKYLVSQGKLILAGGSGSARYYPAPGCFGR